ncbi:MAG: hypothetical protein KME11_18535 [Timaviella obliquedivisa GSE-PSE-MK23-08B]|nr:hypothetical protein [Timaviella obliquedivisa GSE-PSE-MK23-08B]
MSFQKTKPLAIACPLQDRYVLEQSDGNVTIISSNLTANRALDTEEDCQRAVFSGSTQKE